MNNPFIHIIFLLLSIFNVSALTGAAPLFYIDDQANFGDILAEKVVERILRHPVRKADLMEHKVLGIGSIIQFASDKDVIWGSGVNGKCLEDTYYTFKKLDVRAIRGPLTRRFLKNRGIHCPAIYGDPALLVAKLFPEFARKAPTRPYLVIPHLSEIHHFPRSENVCYPNEPWDSIIRKIVDSKLVIASSLHGIVVAESFGVPARLLRVSENEPIFKYIDYYQGSGRKSFTFATSIEEALRMGGEKPHRCDLKALLAAFPHDAFK